MTSTAPLEYSIPIHAPCESEIQEPNDEEFSNRNSCCRDVASRIGNGLYGGIRAIGQGLFAIPQRVYESLYSEYLIWQLPINQLPTEFIQEIERQNKCKDPDAPVALFLLTATDHNWALSSPGIEQLISMLTKTHRIALETVFSNGEIQGKIQEYGLGESEDVMVFACHGNNSSLRWQDGNDPESCLTADNVAKEMFDGLHPKTLIISIGCNTGFTLAQKIADVTGLIVQAPTDLMQASNSWIHKCEKHGLELCAYNSKGQNIIKKFTPLQSQVSKETDSTETCLDPEASKKTFEYQIEQLRLRVDSGRSNWKMHWCN